MLKETDLEQAKKLIESFKPKVTYFEREILVPGILGRLEYVAEIFELFKKLCEDKSVAVHIDAALRNLVDPNVYKLGAPEPKVGEQYLATIARLCDEEFIKPIKEILSSFPKEKTTATIEETTNFLNVASNFFQSIVGCRDRLFLYSLRTFLNVKNTRTGQVMLGEPTEISLILMPFQTRLDELVSVASTTIQSIEKWADQIGEQKTKHVEIIGHLSQVKASEEQARAARWSLYFQIAVIVFTIALVVASQRVNLYLEKRDLDDTVTELSGKLKKSESTISGLSKELSELRAKVESHSDVRSKQGGQK